MPHEFFAALADDARQLAALHAQELDAATVHALQQSEFPLGLALLPQDPRSRGAAAWSALAAAVARLPDDVAGLQRLAADFAAIYLNHRYGSSPCESVWLSDEHLACAEPMLELRALYAAAGLQLATRQQFFDDHLVPQLHYLAHVLSQSTVDCPEPAKTLADFLDEHLGYWFPDFAARVIQAAEQDFYAELAAVTAAWLLELRQCLAEIAAYPPPTRAAMQARIEQKLALRKQAVAPLRFMPGAQGESW